MSADCRPPKRVLHVTEATEAGVATFLGTVARIDPEASFLLLRWRTPTDHLEAVVRDTGAHVEVIPLARIWRSWGAVRRLFNGHEVVALHSGIAGLLGRIAVGLRLVRPDHLVYAPHLSMGYLNPVWRLAERVLTQRVRPQWVMLVSESERRHFLSDFAGRRRPETRIVPPWIAPEGLALPPESPSALDLRLLTIGRVSKQKAPQRIARLLNLVHRHGFGAKFLWVGDGPLRNGFMERLQPGVARRTRVTGWVRDVPSTVAEFGPHFYVNLSLREGFSIAAMEAFAMGLPGIVSRVQGNEDLVEAGRSGLYWDGRSEAAFVEQLRAAIAPDMYTKLREGALTTAKGFSEEALVTAYEGLMHDITGAPRFER